MHIRLEKCDTKNRIGHDAFSCCHPIVNLIYFIFVIGFTIASLNPVCLAITFVSSFIYSVTLKGGRTITKNLSYMIPLIFITAIINPLFSHQGVTVLAYFPSGNPLTLESILYGIAAAIMFVSVLCWFSCFNEVMSSDKMIYLFGRLIPQLSLVISMTLKFIPEFAARIKQVYRAQKAAGFEITGKYFKKTRAGIRAVSSATTWALERAVVTGNSMKSRGYGLKGRTSYSLYSFRTRDIICLIVILLLGILVFAGMLQGTLKWEFYPYLNGNIIDAAAVIYYIVYAILGLFPSIMYITLDR